jgi:cyclopropane-fatty-acyl-phospholipid synthase
MQNHAKQLASIGIYGPDSKEVARYENRLTRFFQREFVRREKEQHTLEALGVSTDHGPILEETESLMENHYDQRPELFSSFLDNRYRAYSMAFYGETAEQVRDSLVTLEEAQEAKFGLIARRAGIEGDERIFNIGCGFGSLETFLLEKYPDIEVVGLTPSKIQVQYLHERMQDPDDVLGDGRFKLIRGSFDSLSLETLAEEKYDLVLSIGVIEHVCNMRSLLERIAAMLVPGGRTFHHFITTRSVIPQFMDPGKTRINFYFPGGRVWPRNEFLRHTEYFDIVNSWFVNGLNYWRTLDEWHHRYWSNILNLYNSNFDIGAIAHWNEYFSLCKSMFAPMEGQFYGNSQYLFKLKSVSRKTAKI